IPNSICPIHISGLATRNGDFFDNDFDGDILGLDQVPVDPPFNVDGHSHAFSFDATAREFGPDTIGGGIRPELIIGPPPAPGVYHYQFSMTDTNGNGWVIDEDFQVSDHNLAVTSIKAPKTISLNDSKPSQTKFVIVTIQNRGPNSETITNLAN